MEVEQLFVPVRTSGVQRIDDEDASRAKVRERANNRRDSEVAVVRMGDLHPASVLGRRRTEKQAAALHHARLAVDDEYVVGTCLGFVLGQCLLGRLSVAAAVHDELPAMPVELE